MGFNTYLLVEYTSNYSSHQVLDIYLLNSRSQPHFYCRNLHSLCRLSPRLIKQPSLDAIASCSIHPQEHCWNSVLVSILQHDVQIPHMAGHDLCLPGCPSLSPDPASYTLFFLEASPVKLPRFHSWSCRLGWATLLISQEHWFSLKFRTWVINLEKPFCLISRCNPSFSVPSL